MVTIRPMTADDVAGAERAWHGAYSTMRAAHHLPDEPRTPESIERLQRRIAHLRATDPRGSWVAVDAQGQVAGLSQALVRDDLWVLSLLGVRPDHQDRRTGKALLDAALTHGADAGRGMILCSRDPRAARRYSRAGFDLHPSVRAWGRVDRAKLPAPSGSVRAGGDSDRRFIAELDGELRGGAHGADLDQSLALGCRLMVVPDAGYVVSRGSTPVFLAAVDEAVAADLLVAVLASGGPDEISEAGWLTGAQQWAIRVCVEAGLELHPAGPMMLRGFDGPPAPYLPSGAFG